jgi:hypothetical protein
VRCRKLGDILCCVLIFVDVAAVQGIARGPRSIPIEPRASLSFLNRFIRPRRENAILIKENSLDSRIGKLC